MELTAPAPAKGRRRRRGTGRAQFRKARQRMLTRSIAPPLAEVWNWDFWQNQWQQPGFEADEFNPLSGFSPGNLHF